MDGNRWSIVKFPLYGLPHRLRGAPATKLLIYYRVQRGVASAAGAPVWWSLNGAQHYRPTGTDPGVSFVKTGLFIDQADSMFVLEAAKVAVLKSWRGQEYFLRTLKEGDCFGEMAVMDLLPRSASVRAVEDCTAIRLSATNLYQVYAQDLEQFALTDEHGPGSEPTAPGIG